MWGSELFGFLRPRHRSDRLLELLAIRFWRLEGRITHMEMEIMSKFDDLVMKVGELKDVEESAVALIMGLREQLAAIADAPTSEQIQSVIDDIDHSVDDLAHAVANPPAEEPPVDAPPAEPTTTG